MPVTNNSTTRPAPPTTPATPATPTPPPAAPEGDAADFSWAEVAKGAAKDAFVGNLEYTLKGGPLNAFDAADKAMAMLGGVVDSGRTLVASADAYGAIPQMRPGDSVDIGYQAKAALAHEGAGEGGALKQAKLSVSRGDDGWQVSTSSAAGVFAALGDEHVGVEVKDVFTSTLVRNAPTGEQAAALVDHMVFGAALDAAAGESGPRLDTRAAHRAEVASASQVKLDGTLSAEVAAKVGLGELFGDEMDAEIKGGASVGIGTTIDPQTRQLTIDRHVGLEAGMEQNLGAKTKIGAVDVVESRTYQLPPGFDVGNSDDVVAVLLAARDATPIGAPSTTIGVGSDTTKGEITFKGARAKDAVKMLATGDVPAGVTVEGEVQKLATGRAIAKTSVGPGHLELETGKQSVLSSRDVDSVSQFKKELVRAAAALDVNQRIGS
jgi:hypothetical protein